MLEERFDLVFETLDILLDELNERPTEGEVVEMEPRLMGEKVETEVASELAGETGLVAAAKVSERRPLCRLCCFRSLAESIVAVEGATDRLSGLLAKVDTVEDASEGVVMLVEIEEAGEDAFGTYGLEESGKSREAGRCLLAGEPLLTAAATCALASSSSSSSSSSATAPRQTAPFPPCAAIALAAFPQLARLLATEVTKVSAGSGQEKALFSSATLGVLPSRASKALSRSVSGCGEL